MLDGRRILVTGVLNHRSIAFATAARAQELGAEQAVGILNRREIEAAEDAGAAKRRLAGAYAAEHLHVDAASAEGFIDEVIAPHSSRARIASCLDALADVHRPPSRASNIPL